MASAPVDDPIAALRAAPDRTGILADFDGTLSSIVDDPAVALPVRGVVDTLGALAKRYRRVAVVSGRPVSFLVPLLPRSLTISGLYGLEEVRRGRRRDHPVAGAWREVIDDVASVSRANGPPGMLVEPKGLSLTLHYRGHPGIEDDVRRWAERQAARSGLVCRPARMSFELHPPIDIDKGTAIRELASGLDAVCYLGDDLGDLRAFAALDELAERGVMAVRVGVNSGEAPTALVDRADLVVEGPAGALDFLRRLL
ncbi:MAG: trehalose-phosphatase [Acidimicrobiales bacterium]